MPRFSIHHNGFNTYIQNNTIDEKQRTYTTQNIRHYQPPGCRKNNSHRKLLLFGGAIHTAGAVKSNKIRRSATSDFMEIEKQRGISVATSVMGFDYNGYKVNILDTPGHKDFARRYVQNPDRRGQRHTRDRLREGSGGTDAELMNVCRMRNTRR